MIHPHVAMSLYGLIAGPGHDMSWTGRAEYETSSQLADEVRPSPRGYEGRERIVKGILDTTMLGRAATLEDVGNAAVFAASDWAGQ